VRRNSRVTGRRICAAVALAVVTAWGIPALAPAALASPAAASAATHSTLPGAHPRDAEACIAYLEPLYGSNGFITAGCTAGAGFYPFPPHISLGVAYALCGGFMGLAGVDVFDAGVACGIAPITGTAFSSTQWCGPNSGNDCLNAWGGGPYVNVYTGGPETGDTNQHFMLIDETSSGYMGPSQIAFNGDGSWSGECIGDANNNSGLADVSLDPCALPGQTAGWGTQMTWGTSGCPTGEAWFHDNHWNGYLGPPAGAVNGSHWYLNKPSPVCFAFILDT
jgi:hypothetical protein